MSELSAIRAIALDTNAFSGGRLAMDQLETLVDRAENHGAVEIWIPEIVVWEWAEHAHQDHAEAVSRLKALRGAGLLAPKLAERSLDDLLEELTEDLEILGDALCILPVVDADVALQDQILQRPPASRVTRSDGKRFKVGAADSALIRSVMSAAGATPAGVVLISRDKGLSQAIRALPGGKPVLRTELVRTANEVFRLTLTFEQSTASRCLQIVQAELPEFDLGELSGSVTGALDVDGQEVANLETTADNIEVAGLSDLYLDRGETYVSGTLHVLADVVVTGAIQDAWGDELVYPYEEVQGAAIEILVTFDLDDDGGGTLTLDRNEADASTPLNAVHLSPPNALLRMLNLLRKLPLAEAIPAEGWPAGAGHVGVDPLRWTP